MALSNTSNIRNFKVCDKHNEYLVKLKLIFDLKSISVIALQNNNLKLF